MRNLIKYILLVSVFAGMVACDSLEPIDENRLDFDYVSTVPQSAEGLLLHGYNGLIDQFIFSEVATDDAVNNKLNNGYKRMALGELTAQFNPASRWNTFERVFYLNRFLEVIEAGEIQWNRDEDINALFYQRMKGEALALRALHHFYVLQAHAGKGASGELLGIPYFTEFIEADGDFNKPRLSFEGAVEAIMKDFDDALDLLPTDYSENESDVDPWYADVDFGKYKVVNGGQYNLRISGRIVKALKARLALFAASPSFLNGQNGYYNMAANTAGEVLNTIGGISGLEPNGIEFYTSDNDINSGEMIWRGSIGGNSSGYEERMFPPSVNGEGEVNPTHNLVMAFPMQNGYPATVANGFDPQNPYANRDPRLGKYIVVNGSSFGGGTINTGVGGGIDRLDSIPQFSTTTGYYLKKLLRPDVRINNDGTTTGKRHYDVYFRYTELFLIFAEAANEIGGPDQQVEGMSARDVIGAIRQRAGITQPDAYLATITTKESMRELIRNERRLELSFEGHRFWDLRRWGVSLNESAQGYFDDGDNYVELPAVEIRNYQPFATYMPIPNAETLKFSELEQNQGW
ncbi:RagB/SusD family nutrient uptake outer membrane protein [Algibacter lectus]|uniref:Putative outer membrane starch-binding protein n=1 Tax=Algibacter lectus TaxID=221126 RepID=A0A4R8MIH7_9FLAO|nr:RagB/SusD family nutrient uptake outer membrane protein [Algibacter lectus]MWW23170.1 RagB/SusD family nutrient uptake outer membrane protein [Algibacter lectus]TDY64152.1 putative outer membrane starch-binding protein [Algibacter lectus]